MKLHKPAIERELMLIAFRGRNGRPLERVDRGRGVWGMLSKPFYLLVLGCMAAGLLGAFDNSLRTDHWQTLFCNLLLTVLALVGSNTLLGPINSRPGYGATLLNLPLPGKQIFEWVRSRFLIGIAPSVVVLSAVGSLARHGFSDAPLLHIAATTVLLAGTTFATMILLEEEGLRRFRVGRIWGSLTALSVAWVVALYFVRRDIFFSGRTPGWQAEGILWFTWIFPPSWCLPGRFENGGALLALPWIAWGILRWISWPARAGPQLDAPQDLAATFGDFEGEEDLPESMTFAEDIPSALEIGKSSFHGSTDLQSQFALLKPLVMKGGGWVNEWVRFVIGERNAFLAAALIDLNAAWTAKTKTLILFSSPYLAIVWAFTRFFPASGLKETITAWIWLITVSIILIFLVPISNGIPRATAGWALGNQGLPVFSLLPVSVRDLLRISMRITFARSAVTALIATPVLWVLFALLSPADNAWTALWLVPAACCFWATSRPLFVWYRLQTFSHRRRGVWLVHAFLTFSAVALAVVWLVSGIAGVMCGFGLSDPDDFRWLPALGIGGLVVSAFSARAIFEIYHWQLTRRHLDWLSSG